MDYINGFIFIFGICILCRYIVNRFSDDKTERELERDKAEADNLTNGIEAVATGIDKIKEKSDRITENQQRITDRITEATESVARAESQSRESIELIDESLRILEEAEEKSWKSRSFGGNSTNWPVD